MTNYSVLFLVRFIFVLIFLSGIITANADQLNTVQQYTSLNKFWTVFRIAVINRDIETVAKLSRFPIRLRGEMDFDPVIKMSKNSLIKYLDIILAYKTADPSIIYPKTTLEFFKHTKKIKGDSMQASARNFDFILSQGHWLWFQTYVDSQYLN